jgi:hypothetical protein
LIKNARSWIIASMKGKQILIPLIVVAVIAAVAVSTYLVMNPVVTTLEFQARDAVSKNWVYDATFRLQNREIRSFFQSDRGPEEQRFSNLKTGKATLELSAPHYVPVSYPLVLKRGQNRIESPFDLVGYEIPELKEFIIFENKTGNDIQCEIRPASKAGPAVVNHPCLDLWIGARVSVQMKNGLPVQQETESGSVRGEELFRGRIDWHFDPYPETVFRYSALIPGAKIKPTKAPYWVVDYLIVVPDPRKISKEELNGIMENAGALTPEELQKYLQPYQKEQKLETYVSTSWNVKGGEA